MCRSSQVRFQTKQDYIPSKSVKLYETVNTQVEFEDAFHPDAQVFFCQKLIEEVPDATAVIMLQLSLNLGINNWKVKGIAEAESEINQLHFVDTFKPRHYIELNEDQKKIILEFHIFSSKR